MNIKNGMCILEFRSLYEYTILSLRHEKLYHILVGAFKAHLLNKRNIDNSNSKAFRERQHPSGPKSVNK